MSSEKQVAVIWVVSVGVVGTEYFVRFDVCVVR